MNKITVKEFKKKIDNNKDIFLLDVREPFEQYQSKLNYEQSTLIPLGQLADRIDDISSHKSREVVCMCRSGKRSARACKLLEKEGFEKVANLEGGINEWAKKIDNSLPVY